MKRARFWMLALALLACAGTARLGFWQLDRAQQKLDLQAAADAALALPPLGASELPLAQAPHRRVRLRGHWLSAHTVWLDNRPMEGRAGFYVVTPLRLAETGRVLLVQRGWAPRDPYDRQRLPTLRTPSDEVGVEGQLVDGPSRLYDLGSAGSGAIRQNLDIAAFGREAGIELLPYTVVQTDPATDDGLFRHWPAPDVGLHKHYGYAFQWFALCALIACLYVWFQLLRPRFRARHAD